MSQSAATDVISVEDRPARTGKGDARKLRKNGWAPAVAYGPSFTPRHLALDSKLFTRQRLAYGRSHLYTVSVKGGPSFRALIKDVSQDPVTGVIRHVDLYAVDMTKPIRVSVRIDLVGKPAGVVHGGILTQVMRSLEIMCLPDRIPESITLDVSPLELGASAHISDLKLAEGLHPTALHDEAIAAVVAPQRDEPKAASAEGEAAAGAGAAPAAGAKGAAPAAGAKGAAPAAGAKGAAPAAGAKGAAPAAGAKGAAAKPAGKK